jgi:hypothetical protein
MGSPSIRFCTSVTVIAILTLILAGSGRAASLTLAGTGIGSQALGQQEPWFGSYSFIWLDGANHPPRVASQWYTNPWPAQHAGSGTAASGWTSLDNAQPGRYAFDFEGYSLQRETIYTAPSDPNYGHEHRWYAGSPTWRLVDTLSGNQVASGTSDVFYLDVNYAPATNGNGYWSHGSATFTVNNDGGAFYNELIALTGHPNLAMSFVSTTPPVKHLADGQPLADGWGEYSTSVTLTPITGTYRLTMAVVSDTPGKGGGSITSNPGGIACTGTGSDPAGTTGNCFADFVPGQTITLLQAPDADSAGAAWSQPQCVTGRNCQVVLDANQQVTATFAYAHMARVATSGLLYDTLAQAYGAAAGTDTILARGKTFSENVTLDGGKVITLSGGLSASYAPQNDWTTLQGVLTIKNGSLTVDRLELV